MIYLIIWNNTIFRYFHFCPVTNFDKYKPIKSPLFKCKIKTTIFSSIFLCFKKPPPKKENFFRFQKKFDSYIPKNMISPMEKEDPDKRGHNHA